MPQYRARSLLLITVSILVTQTPASESSDTVETGKEEDRYTQKEFVIGYRTSAPLFSYESADDGERQPDGYSVEICRYIEAEILKKRPGIQIRWEGVESYNRFDKLRNREIDLLCGTTTVSLERLRNFESSLFIFLTGASFVCTQKSRATSIADMDDKKIGYLKGSTTEAVAKRLLKEKRIEPQEWIEKLTYSEAMESLKENNKEQPDCFFADRDVLAHYIKNWEDPRPYLSHEYFSLEPYGIFMRRDEPELEFLVNKVLVEMFSAEPYSPKSIHRVFNKYFKNAQMSTYLRMLFVVQSIPLK